MIKILSYNIHKGFSIGNRYHILDEIRHAIRSVDADVVFLQEVAGAQSDTEAQFEFLADEIWPHFAYGRNAVYTAGHHGNAILSKFPVIEVENIDVSKNRFAKRGILYAVCEDPDLKQRYHFVCIHLDLLERSRLKQVEDLCQLISSRTRRGEPVLCCGDFNDWRVRISNKLKRELGFTEVFQQLHRRHARTFPAPLPMLCLDRIYYRGLLPKTAIRWRGAPWNRLSDHAAISAEFSVPRDAAEAALLSSGS